MALAGDECSLELSEPLKIRVKHQWKRSERDSSLKASFLPSASKSSSLTARSLQTPQMLRQKPELMSDLSAPNQEIKKPLQDDVAECQKRPLFQLVFLGNDTEQSVEVKEVDEVDFTEVKLRLENGESVFMTRRECEKVEIGELDKEAGAKGAEKPWYIAHV